MSSSVKAPSMLERANPTSRDALAAGSEPSAKREWQHAPSPQRGRGAQARGLLLVLATALGAHALLWPWFWDVVPNTFDERDFNALAINMLERGEYAIRAGEPTSLRPPLYPTLVAATYAVAGKESFQAVRLVQIAINLLTVVLIYCIARELFSARVALWAAGLSAFYPSLALYNYLLLTEVLFTFWLCLMVLCTVRFLKHGGLTMAGLAGVSLGLAALTRSAIWLYPPVLVGVGLCAVHLPWSRRLLGLAVLLASFVATLTPWSIRNTRLQGTLTVVDTTAARVLRWSLGAVVHPEEPAPSEPVPAKPESATEGQVEQRALRQSLLIILERPLATIAHMLTQFFEFWGLERELVAGALEGHFGPVPGPVVLAFAIVICGYYVLMMLTGTLGIAAAPSPARLPMAFVLSVVVFVCLILTLVYGHSRYHVTIMPLIILFSASALAEGRALFQTANRRRLGCALTAYAVLVSYWIWRVVSEDLQTLVRQVQP